MPLFLSEHKGHVKDAAADHRVRCGKRSLNPTLGHSALVVGEMLVWNPDLDSENPTPILM